MPIYEYECAKCGEFEVTQRITEPPLKKCPKCKTRKVRKLISQTSFQLKGEGWYVTDYARKGKAKGDGAAEDGKSTETADSKPEAKKTETKSSDTGAKKKGAGGEKAAKAA